MLLYAIYAMQLMQCNYFIFIICQAISISQKLQSFVSNSSYFMQMHTNVLGLYCLKVTNFPLGCPSIPTE